MALYVLSCEIDAIYVEMKKRLTRTYWGLQCHWPTMANIPECSWFKVGNAEDHKSTTSLLKQKEKEKEKKEGTRRNTISTCNWWTVWKERNLRCFATKKIPLLMRWSFINRSTKKVHISTIKTNSPNKSFHLHIP